MCLDTLKKLIVGGSDFLTTANILDPYMSPSLGISLEVGKLLLNKTSNSHPLQKNYIEFLTFVGKNQVSVEKNLPHVHCVSGLVTLYEFTMKQRFEEKRFQAFSIYLGFLNSKHKKNLSWKECITL